jgi:hypothetical protein
MSNTDPISQQNLRQNLRERFIRDYEQTENPVEFLDSLSGVDPDWTQEYLQLSGRFHQFPFHNDVVHVSPRLVKIILLRPFSLIRLLDSKHIGGDKTAGGLTWEQYREGLVNGWPRRMKITWDVSELIDASECFAEGLTPIEAMMAVHSDTEDGDEGQGCIAACSEYMRPAFIVCGSIALTALMLFVQSLATQPH